MLGVSHYSQNYIDDCRAMMRDQLSSYGAIARVAKPGPALVRLEQQFMNHLILALDRYFVHRLRGKELKDGNPLNEVRMLCTSLLERGGVFTADATIKYSADKSVLKLKTGDRIVLTVGQFEKLAEAFFADIEAKFRA
jgi:hypothetical protein